MSNLELLKDAQKGDKNSYNQFFKENQGLVFSLLKRFDINRNEYEDILQEANYALCVAIKKYDFKYGVNFSTYAVPIILGEIKRYFRDNSTLKVSRGLKDLSRKINLYLDENNEKNINLELLSEHFKETKERILEALTLKNYVCSFDEEILDNKESIINNFSNESISLLDMTSLKLGLSKLDKKERLIVELRYYQGYSQQEVSDRLNMSQVQVSRMENKILSKLKELI